jgi:serine/threonine protein kinase
MRPFAASSTESANADGERPQKVGRYHILRLLGAGGMGAVYEAYDPQLSRKVAIKVLKAETPTRLAGDASGDCARLVQEAKNLARVSHPNIVPIFDVGIEEDQTVFLAMELVHGRSLTEVLKIDRGKWQANLRLVMQAGRGLAAAHHVGLLHRDFKPDNIIVGQDGIVRVLDFGLSTGRKDEASANPKRVLGARLHRQSHGEAGGEGSDTSVALAATQFLGEGEVLGTPAYMPPEQIVGAATTVVSDLFALALVCYEAICGERPFPSTQGDERLQAIATMRVKWPRRIPRSLRAPIERALSFEMQSRGDGVAPFLDELERAVRSDSRRRSFRKWSAALVLGSAALLPILRGGSREVDPDCVPQDKLVDEVWNEASRQHLTASFGKSEQKFADEMATRASQFLDQWSRQWRESARHLCPNYRLERALQPFEMSVREQSRSCLAESVAEVRAVLNTWQDPSMAQVLGAENTLKSISEPRSCIDLETLRDRAPLPSDPVERTKIRDELAAIQGAEVQIRMAEIHAARELLTEMKLAHPRGFHPIVQAQWAHAMAELVRRETNDAIESSTPLSRAILSSLAVDRPQISVPMILDLWFVRVYRGNAREENESMFRQRKAWLARFGFPRRHVIEHERHQGIWACMNGRFEQALVHLRTSYEHAAAVFGDKSMQAAQALDDLGYTSSTMGDLQQAIVYYQQSLAVRREIFPSGHPHRSRAAFQLADLFARTGHLFAGSQLLWQSWRESYESQLPAESSADLQWMVASNHVALGDYQLALWHLFDLRAIEHQLGRRIDPYSTWSDASIAEVLLARGETSPALELFERGEKRLGAEVRLHPNAVVSGLLQSAKLATLRGDRSRALTVLDRLDALVQETQESASSSRAQLWAARGEVAQAFGEPTLAAIAFERALFEWQVLRPAAQELAPLQLGLAQALFDLGDLEPARYHAEQALLLELEVDELAPHLFVRYYELCARIALAQGRLGDAALDLERAFAAFDAVEVVDNRRASLHFLAAQLAHNLDGSAPGRKASEALALRAWREYADWDFGGEQGQRSVRQWLQAHGFIGSLSSAK